MNKKRKPDCTRLQRISTTEHHSLILKRDENLTHNKIKLIIPFSSFPFPTKRRMEAWNKQTTVNLLSLKYNQPTKRVDAEKQEVKSKNVCQQSFPYIRSSTPGTVGRPSWWLAAKEEEVKRRLRSFCYRRIACIIRYLGYIRPNPQQSIKIKSWQWHRRQRKQNLFQITKCVWEEQRSIVQKQ